MKSMDYLWLVVGVLAILPLVAITSGIKKVLLTWKGKKVK